MPKARPAQVQKEDLNATIQAGIPLKQLNLRGLDTDTRLVLAEKEQSLLGQWGWLFQKIKPIYIWANFHNLTSTSIALPADRRSSAY